MAKAYKKWKSAELAFLKANFESMTNDALAAHFGVSRSRIQWQLARHGWKRSSFKKWSAEEIAFIKANAHLGEPGLAKAMNIGQDKIRSVLRNRRIRTGGSGRFKKGQNPWNVGLRVCFSPRTTFKKGIVPVNTQALGTIRTRKDKHGKLYQVIKVEPGTGNIGTERNWEYLSRYVWKQIHGAIPDKCLIRHRDSNPLNNAIENLECITMAANSLRNRNDKKRAVTLAEGWMNGMRYENDGYIAKLLAPGDTELQQAILAQPELIETKRQQLILKRKLNNKPYEQPYQTKSN